MDKPRRVTVWFNRATAVLWIIGGIAAFPLGWSTSVALVWVASVWANVKSDWATAEAADDSEILKAISELHADVAGLREQLADMLTTSQVHEDADE